MSLFNIAVIMRKGMYRLISWWPSLLKKDEAEGDQIVRYPIIELDLLLRNFLRPNNKGLGDLREIGAKNIMLYMLDKENYERKTLLEGIIYLIASYPNFLTDMRQWLEDNGYDLGTFDIE